MVEQAAKLGKKVTLPSGEVVDFSGMGDAELAREQARVNAETADYTAQAILGVQQKYGAQFNAEALKRLEEADPTGVAARRYLAQTVLSEAKLGSGLSADEEGQMEQQIRRGQAARGNILGNAPTVQEVTGKFELGQKLKQQRLSNVAAYVMGTPLTAQYQNLSAAQNQAAPYQPVAYQPGTGLNPNAGAQGAAFASSTYGTQAGMYGMGLNYSLQQQQMQANAPNPWMQGLGLATGVGSTLGGAALMGCWVAREVYGEKNPRWMMFRKWLFTQAPKLLRLAYLKYGERFAAWIHNKPALKAVIRKWMDARIESMEVEYGQA